MYTPHYENFLTFLLSSYLLICVKQWMTYLAVFDFPIKQN